MKYPVQEVRKRNVLGENCPGQESRGVKCLGPKSPGAKSPNPKCPGAKHPGPKSPGPKHLGPKSPVRNVQVLNVRVQNVLVQNIQDQKVRERNVVVQNVYIKVLKVNPVHQQMILSPKLGVVEFSTLWHFRLPLLIQIFIKVASSPRLSGIGMPSPIL